MAGRQSGSFDDPAAVTGPEAHAAFRRARDEIATRIRFFVGVHTRAPVPRA